jgi:biopolymer transport protein TolQ
MNQLSLSTLIGNADPVVQLIMLLLLIASIYCWAIIIQKFSAFKAVFTSSHNFRKRFWGGNDMATLYAQLKKRANNLNGLEHLFYIGFKEFVRLRQSNYLRGQALIDGVERSMRIALAKETEKLEYHLSLLGTIGAVAPYVGLLGTVWGIMASFTVLGGVEQATLSMVAPHIAEALIATALGLFVAIPAVIAYNRFSTRLEQILTDYENFHDELCVIFHREAFNQHD